MAMEPGGEKVACGMAKASLFSLAAAAGGGTPLQ
jgi:hypothetical protein